MSNRVCPTVDEMQQIEQWIKNDQMLQAHTLVQQIGPLENWEFGKPLHKASLLMSRLGGRRKSEILDILNYRDDRQDLDRILSYQYKRVSYVPSVRILQDLTEIVDQRKSEMKEKQYADFLIFKAWMLASLRDFSAAYALIDEAKVVLPDYSWLHVEEADILEKQDRYEEALVAAERAIECRPLYHNANLKKEVLLFHLNRDDEAIALLEQMHQTVEHSIYASRLQYRYSERDEHEKALWALEEYLRYSPLLAKESREWCANRKADFLYLKGEIDEAKEVFAKSEKHYYKEVFTNLSRPDVLELPSKKLAVNFVRQHSMTCAPATLAALSAYYGVAKDHLEISDAICYDGTPWHKERTWAEENGFLVYEFKLTEKILMELIEKELPFTLSTVAVTSAHLQACIGYDARSKIVFIRDPTDRHYGEMLLDNLIKEHPASGPRGMLFIPKELESKVSDTHFPDQHLYDCRHELMLALDDHDILKVDQAIATMRAIDEQHPFVIQSELRVAEYRRDLAKAHELRKVLHERFPENESFTLDYFRSSLGNCGRDEQLRIARKAVAVKSPDPVFYAELGDLYLEDLRELPMAEYYLKKAAVNTFCNSRSLDSLATCAFRKQELENVTKYRRYASCKSQAYEGYAYDYFRAAVQSGEAEQAILYLRERVEIYGKKESSSWITLSRAYESLHRDSEARQVILDAIAELPDDSDLLLHMVDRSHFWGREKQAEEYLKKAREHCSNVRWHFAAGRHAEFCGNRKRALLHFKQVVEDSPRYTEGLRRYASALEDEYGENQALDFLEEKAQQHPNSVPVLECYAIFINRGDDVRMKPVLDKILELEPNNLWASREKALLNERIGEVESAIALGEETLYKQPNSEESLGILGGIYFRNGDKEKAVELYKKALTLEVDYTYAFNQWMNFVQTPEQRKEALDFYKQELFSQSADGGSLRSYRNHAFNVIDSEELLHTLHTFRTSHPYEWEAWVVEKDQLLDMGRVEDAQQLMTKAQEMFPYLPRIQVEIASIYGHKGETQKEVEHLELALEKSPSWDWCARQLADAYELLGDYKNTEKTLLKAVQWGPLVASNHGCYADFLKKLGRRDEAFDALKTGLRTNAHYDWGWREIAYLAKDLGREDEVYALIESHDEVRKRLVSWWDIKFDIYDTLDEKRALAHCEQGIEQFPNEVEPYDSKAYLLGKLGKIDAAIEATKPTAFGDDTPYRLRGRRAVIYYNNHQQDEAFELMEAAIKEQPDYLFAIRKLADWYTERENYKRAKEIVEMWLRYEPRSHVARGHLGDLYEKQGKKLEAAQQYQEAFQINPEYQYAGYRGFELALEAHQLEHIPQIISLTSHYGSQSEAVEMEVRYLHKIGKLDEAFESYQRLIAMPDADIEEIGKTVELFPKQGKKQLDALVESGNATNPNLLVAWLWEKDNYLKTADKIAKLPYENAMKNQLWGSYLSWIYDCEDEAVFKKFYAKHSNVGDIDVELWGHIGRGLASNELYEQCAQHFSGIDQKEGAEDWMYANYATAKLALGEIAQAAALLRTGMSITTPGGVFNYLSSMLAPLEAGLGNDDSAQQLLDQHYGDLSSRFTAYRQIATLILMASPEADKLDLKTEWQVVKIWEPEWKNVQLMKSLVNFAREAVIKRGAKWPGGSALKWKIFG